MSGVDFIAEKRSVGTLIPMAFIVISASTVPFMVIMHIKKDYDNGTLTPENITGFTGFIAAFEVK